MKRLTLFALLLCNIFCYSYAQEPGNYKPKNPNVIFRQSKLPIVIMNTNNTMIEKEDRVMIDMTIINNGDGKWNYADLEKYPDQTIEYQGKINIRYRGNTSFSLSEKKPYSIKTVNEDGSKNEVPLLDMPAHNDWVMLAPYSDRSMMRDILLHKLSRGYFEYSPIHRFCELQLDGTYYGVFLFGERQKRGDDRINVKKCGTSGINLTGGYHIQVDRNSEPVYSSLYPCKTSDDITLSKVTYYQYKYPEYEDMEQVQLDWINNRIHEFETSFMIDDYRDETVGYRNYIDVSSFIYYMIFEELSRNCDAYKLSTNLHKHRDDVDNGRFRITLWDFNLGLGNCNFSRAFETDTWSFTSTDYNHADAGVPPYWDQLVKDERFMAEVRDSWREIRKTTLSDENIIHHIDSMASLLDNSGAVLRNNAAWPTWNNYIWPNYYVSSSFADEIRFLKEWTFERIKFLDENWGSEPLFNDGYRYSIRNYSNNMKLYIDKYGEAGLSNLELGDDNEFIFERVDTTPYYKIKSSLYDLYLTKSESTAPNEYVLADQLSGDDQTKQHWMFEKLKDSYKIISRHNGHLIRTRSNGDLVSYYNVDYSADRKWHVDTEFIPSSIGSVSSENSAKIYSANSIIYISNVTQDAQITIFNLKGQTVYGGNILSGNDYTIDMPAKETVVIIIKTAEGNVSSQKIVIN